MASTSYSTNRSPFRSKKRLRDKVEQTGRTLALTHTYSGYPGVKEARERFARGDFGKIRKIFVEYTQGWLSTRVELDPASNAGWRTDPSRSGKAGTMGDIGTHALQLAEYISGQRCTSLCADLRTVVEGRLLDDDGAALLRFDGGATGVLVITLMYLLRENRAAALAVSYVLLAVGGSIELYALPGFLALLLYNGKRGRQPKRFFYWFYPVHITVLVILRQILFHM